MKVIFLRNLLFTKGLLELVSLIRMINYEPISRYYQTRKYVIRIKVIHPGAHVPTIAHILPGFNFVEITDFGWVA